MEKNNWEFESRRKPHGYEMFLLTPHYQSSAIIAFDGLELRDKPICLVGTSNSKLNYQSHCAWLASFPTNKYLSKHTIHSTHVKVKALPSSVLSLIFHPIAIDSIECGEIAEKTQNHKYPSNPPSCSCELGFFRE